MSLDYFPWYHSYLKKCEKLKDQELGRLVRALTKYSDTGERQELAGCESIAFDFIADDIDRAKKSYEEKCQKNRENGKKASGTVRGRTVPNAPQSENKDKDKNEKKEISPDGDIKKKAVAAVLADYLDRVNPTASTASLDELKGYAEEMGEAVCKRAFDIALDNKITRWPYIRSILQDKLSKGVKCLADWDALEAKRKEDHSGRQCDDREPETAKFGGIGTDL